MHFSHLLLAIVATLAILLSACNTVPKGPYPDPDPKFSWNLVDTPQTWPDEEKSWSEDPDIALAQQNVYERYGAPDYFRVVWFRDGRLASATDVHQVLFGLQKRQMARTVRDMPREWIYLDEKLGFMFPRSGVERRELEDWYEILADYGDPHEIKESTGPTGRREVSFHYVDSGNIFYFMEGKKIREDKVQGVPGMTIKR